MIRGLCHLARTVRFSVALLLSLVVVVVAVAVVAVLLFIIIIIIIIIIITLSFLDFRSRLAGGSLTSREMRPEPSRLSGPDDDGSA